MAIGLEIALQYPFMPPPPLNRTEGDRVILQFPDAPEANKAEAARLAERAAKHAGNGNCHCAIVIWQRVLILVSSDLVARREPKRPLSPSQDSAGPGRLRPRAPR